VTVTPNGDVSWRAYGDGPVGTMKVDAVGDWDLSGLEDETLVIGGTDGTVGLSSCGLRGTNDTAQNL
jgi:hypothetical protein